MNAAEAKAKSLSNAPKIVDAYVTIAIAGINSAIKDAIKIGEFTSIKTLAFPKAFENDVIKRLEIHYQELGYSVSVRDFFFSKQLQISWAE